MSNREQVIAPTVALTSSETVSTVIDIVGWAQLGVEIDIVDRTGVISVLVELGPDDNAFYPETIEDPAGITPTSNDLAIPLYRHIRTWNDNGSFAFQIPCGGYQKARVKVSVETSAHGAVYLNKLRLAAN
jgi:hypothetical protein